MRKWMRERIQRRKKDSPKEETPETTAAPLQPAYFDAQAPDTAPMADDRPEPRITEANDDAGSLPEDAAPKLSHAAAREPGHSQKPAPRLKVTPEPGNEDDTSDAIDPEAELDAAAHAIAQGGVPPSVVRSTLSRRRRGRGGRGRNASQRGIAATSHPAPVVVTPDVPPAVEPVTAPAAIADATKTTIPRAPKGSVILAIGLPGSGKSSWFKRHEITPLSSDMLRALLFDDATEQRFQDLIFSNLRSMLKARLIARRPLNYVDATNLTPQERASWIKLGKDYGYEVQAVFFDVPLEVCLQRNQKRPRTVAEDVMRRMAAKLKPPTFEEGFSKITVVKVKQKDATA